MKIIKILSILFVITAVASSCSTQQQITVYSNPGTEIYTPNGSLVGRSDEKGEAKLTLSDGSYYALLFAKDPSIDIPVPFAIDYHKNNRFWTRCAYVTGIGLASVGLTADAIGCIAMVAAAASGDDDMTNLFGMVVAGGSAAAGLGVALGCPADSRLKQPTYEYNVAYNKKQITNNDLPLIKPMVTYYSEDDNGKNLSKSVNSGSDNSKKDKVDKNSSKESTKSSSSRSTRTIKDNVSSVVGEYVGNGSISRLKKTIETYDNMTLVIAKAGNNTVYVNIIDEDSNMFFDEDDEYKVTKNKNGTYTLTCIKVPNATITIDKNNNLVYKHPKVNIDDDIYTLTLKAIKSK